MKKIVMILSLVLLTSCGIKKPIETKKELVLKENTFEYGQLYKLSDIFENADIFFEDEYLNIDTLGQNKVELNYQKDKINYRETVTYEVVDKTGPLVWIKDNYNIKVGYEGNIAEDIICADNFDPNPYCYIIGSYDVNEIGTYKLKMVGEDKNGNITEVPFKLHVKKDSQKVEKNNDKTIFSDVVTKYKNDDTMIGIDVSKWQGEIDFSKVKNAGVEFVIIRMGTQDGFGGDLFLDKYFERNIQNALKNDLQVGLYFYSYAKTNEEAINAANFVIENIQNYEITLPIAFDWENFNYFNDLDLSLFDLRKISYAFQDEIKKAGYTPIHYGSKNYLEAFWSPMKYDSWLANYNIEKSTYSGEYKIWQLCNNGKIDGINSDVDIDIYYK